MDMALILSASGQWDRVTAVAYYQFGDARLNIPGEGGVV